jgi:dihydrofolate reductase
MNSYKKYVFSHGEQKKALGWSNSELVVVHDDRHLIRFIKELKAQPGKDIHLSGGARLAQTFVRLGLVDEYHFYEHPVVSVGATWFDQMPGKRDLRLLSTKSFEKGIVGLYYQPRGSV